MRPLHQKAIDAFNRAAQGLLLQLTARPREPDVPSGKDSDVHIAAQLGEADVDLSSVREYVVDHTGTKRACFFHSEPRGIIGLIGAHHEELLRLVERLSRHAAFENELSTEFVYDTTVDWLQSAATPQGNSFPTYIDYLTAQIAKEVKQYDIWLPIPVVSIPHPITFGGVVLRRITKEMMDKYSERIDAAATPRRQFVFDNMRTQFQAVTAACVTVKAEPIRADQLANLEAEAPIALFRFACPAFLSADHWAPIDPSLIDGLGASTNITVEGGHISSLRSRVPPDRLMQWVITPELVAEYMKGLWTASHRLLIKKRSEFEELLLSSVVQYSKSILKPDLSERLVYVVSALETLFVRQSESIVQNLRERLAMFPERLEERTKLATLVTEVYDLRSRFVHGALPTRDKELLGRFFFETWTILYFIINNHDRWSTKSDFLNYLDSYKMRGPPIRAPNLLAVDEKAFRFRWTQRM